MWGLAFKPNTDDIREAPAIYIIQDLLDAGAEVHAYDPEGMPNMAEIHPGITMGENEYDILEDADLLAIVTEWGVFRSPDFDKIKSKLKAPVIFDGRNMYDVEETRDLGFYYDSIGRP